MNERPPVYYGDYLQLDKLLDAQHPLSKKYATEAHDETLFIIIHQAYELWFKQILHEINSVYDMFNKDKVTPQEISVINHRLNRVVEIQRVLNAQLRVIETMTPMDFMEFRDFLTPASGFQSIQFRLIELTLGLREKFRTPTAQKFFESRLNKEHKELLKSREQQPTLLELIDNWLQRMPFTQSENFEFWKVYKESVNRMLQKDEDTIKSNQTLSEHNKSLELKNLEATRSTFESLFNEEVYNKLRSEGLVQLSRDAKLAAIFIKLFRHEPMMQLPFNLIQRLIDIDESFTTWRQHHAIMAHRMLGTKIGTGGSSGHEYLKRSADNNKIFKDFFNIATFLVPADFVPQLPENLRKKMGFYYE